ncbi:MAG: hypothetical protein ACLTHR_14905 [Agathobacter rectalis]
MSDIEIYENDLLFYLNEFCEANKIEDIKKRVSKRLEQCFVLYSKKSYLILITLSLKRIIN